MISIKMDKKMEACDEETPLLLEKKENCHKKITYKEAMIHMMKANVGTGIFELIYCFQKKNDMCYENVR